MFQALDPSNNYPTANNCPTPGATEICIKTSGSNTLISNNGYTVNNLYNTKYFSIIANNSTVNYRITNDSIPVTYTSLATTDPANWIVIGNQVWARSNMNVGSRINGAVAQTNNAVLEKYCYGDLDANCTTYGGLYQWDEAMQYVVTAGAQGICPAGSHIPTSGEWTTLISYLGTASAGTQVKAGGGAGLNTPLGGHRWTGGSFGNISSSTRIWTSSDATTQAWESIIQSGSVFVLQGTNVKNSGMAIRCVGN